MNQDIRLNDFHRIFIGAAPPEFLFEVFCRTILVYVIFFFVMRLLGKRMNGQLTVTEMVLILTLGAIISIPMQAVDKGVLQGLIVLFCAFLFQRLISYYGVKNESIEKFTQGCTKILVKDGVFQLNELKKNRISQELLFSKLRSENIYNLGQVKRLYVEASGLFSIYKTNSDCPGLSTLPSPDECVIRDQKKAEGFKVCIVCGTTIKDSHQKKCDNCGDNRWGTAVI